MIICCFFSRQRTKAAILLTREGPSSLINRAYLLHDGSTISTDGIDEVINSVTAQEVSALATKIMKSKGGMVSVGNLDDMCYLEDLA